MFKNGGTLYHEDETFVTPLFGLLYLSYLEYPFPPVVSLVFGCPSYLWSCYPSYLLSGVFCIRRILGLLYPSYLWSSVSVVSSVFVIRCILSLLCPASISLVFDARHIFESQAPEDSDGQEKPESTTASKWALTFFWRYLQETLGRETTERVLVVRKSANSAARV